MAGITHILGGGAAVNLGPLIRAVQNSLGLSDVGIKVGTTPMTGGNWGSGPVGNAMGSAAGSVGSFIGSIFGP